MTKNSYATRRAGWMRYVQLRSCPSELLIKRGLAGSPSRLRDRRLRQCAGRMPRRLRVGDVMRGAVLVVRRQHDLAAGFMARCIAGTNDDMDILRTGRQFAAQYPFRCVVVDPPGKVRLSARRTVTSEPPCIASDGGSNVATLIENGSFGSISNEMSGSGTGASI